MLRFGQHRLYGLTVPRLLCGTALVLSAVPLIAFVATGATLSHLPKYFLIGFESLMCIAILYLRRYSHSLAAQICSGRWVADSLRSAFCEENTVQYSESSTPESSDSEPGGSARTRLLQLLIEAEALIVAEQQKANPSSDQLSDLIQRRQAYEQGLRFLDSFPAKESADRGEKGLSVDSDLVRQLRNCAERLRELI